MRQKGSAMPINGIDHYNVACSDLDVSRKFYKGVLGMEEGSRPNFDAPGAWFYAGGHPIVHLSPRKMRPSKTTGRFDHIALFAEDLPKVLSRLKRKKVNHAVRIIPELEGNVASGGRQVFIWDPDGVKIELNFKAGERIPRGTKIADRVP